MNAHESALAIHVRRIFNEYLEMPDLCLTCAQALRLWALETDTCVDALRVLVDAGFLRITKSGQYVRLTDGSAPMPPLRMAKADLKRSSASRLTA